MHGSVQQYVSAAVTNHGLSGKSCLDVGSLDVNGSVRQYFNGEYVGIDIRGGPSVDLVLSAHDIVPHFGEARFEVVVCCEMLEHDRRFWVTMDQIGKVLKPEGRLLLTTRGINYVYHEHPWDCWRFTEEAGRILGELAGLRNVEVGGDPEASGIFMTGIR